MDLDDVEDFYLFRRLGGLEAAGAKGVVMFNRFYQPNIDLQTLQVSEPNKPMFLFQAGVDLRQIVDAINQVGASPSALIAILLLRYLQLRAKFGWSLLISLL